MSPFKTALSTWNPLIQVVYTLHYFNQSYFSFLKLFNLRILFRGLKSKLASIFCVAEIRFWRVLTHHIRNHHCCKVLQIASINVSCVLNSGHTTQHRWLKPWSSVRKQIIINSLKTKTVDCGRKNTASGQHLVSNNVVLQCL